MMETDDLEIVHTPVGVSCSTSSGVNVTTAPNVGPPVVAVSKLHDPTVELWRRRDTGYASFDGNQLTALALSLIHI